jgi:Uma2 family endonuclease
MSAVATLEPVAAPAAPLNGEEALYEIAYGKRVELPPMSIYAVRMASRLSSRMDLFAVEHQRGTVVTEGLFILDAERDLRRRPDVAFVSAESWPLDRELPEEGDWQVVPDLAVEVLSPNDLFAPVLAKLREYFEVGVRQVWVIVPSEKQVYVYDSPTQTRILSEADELDGGVILSGFKMAVAALFQRRPNG